MQILGYACINTELSKNGVSVNRGMIRRTFDTSGLPLCGELAEKNLIDLLSVLTWNYNNSVSNYRMSSDMFPWMSEYALEDLPNFHYSIQPILEAVGDSVLEFGHKISFHPGQFDCLASPNPDIVSKTIFDLEQHARIMDLMRLPANPLFNINIHVGGIYGDKVATIDRFAKNFEGLSESLRSRLTIENDDTKNGYRVEDLILLHQRIGVPIVFDTLHWQCNPGELSYQSAFELAHTTWHDVIPEIHHSSSKRTYEDPTAPMKAHADYLYEKAETFEHTVYVTVESKAKEQAVLQYREKFVKEKVLV